MRAVIETAHLDQLPEAQVRALAARLITEVRHKQATIEKLTHEMAVLKRLKFAAKSEAFTAEQKSLLEETIDEDLEALSRELEREQPAEESPRAQKQQPKRQPLPAHLPRREIRHEPEATVCGCGCLLKRIGEDIAEKLDYTPGVFTVERHIRGKWVCTQCETLSAGAGAGAHHRQGPADHRIAGAGAGGQVRRSPAAVPAGSDLRAGRDGLSRSTLAQWVGACGVQLQPLVDALKAEMLTRPVLHADETPVAMLKPGHGKTHRAYLWSYGTTVFDPIKAVVFDFAESRAGRHVQTFFGQPTEAGWRGTLICDDYAGYKSLFGDRITEAGCLAHARRKFFDLWANHKSTVAEQALVFFGQLYDARARGGRPGRRRATTDPAAEGQADRR